MDTIFRVANYWLPKVKPKFAVILATHPHRLDLWQNNKLHRLLPSKLSPAFEKENTQIANFYKTWLSDEKNSKYNKVKNLMAIRQVCAEAQIKLFEFDYTEYFSFYEDYASDKIHFGPKTNKSFAEHVIRTIEQYIK